ncbi:TPA: hypothetical protein N0F65_005099 [Lagenidium giganteum]|uniref:Thaumatin-like protein n=1 Tax=Lagenidium giganteum TaxID=4803 RepID=A0AAV2ZBB9_9STRA|nr:TPA: hypothetical protein N0F65_005099 [Lagenidium giganteum]
MDTVYGIVFDTAGAQCLQETGINILDPWNASPSEITVFCGNTNCKTVNQRLHDAYPKDCYVTHLQVNLLNGLFGELSCVPDISDCGAGQYPISVEGIRPIYCISGKACAGDASDGICPGPQLPDLPYGSTCGLVRTNVYGCKPYLDAAHTKVGEVSAADLPNCSKNPVGNTPVSVVGQGTFCAAWPVCSGKQQGNCPGMQFGLAKASRCDYVRPGVYGCVMP